MLLIYSKSTNSYFNVAMEEYLLKNFNEDLFILWRNEPCVLIGKNQNTLDEINLNYIKENNIPVVRRLSGGGAVFNDLGNINFTFIANNENNFSDFKRFTKPIISLLNKLNVNAEFSGRNDLLIEGKKFSGNAQYNYKNKVMHHGTLLFSSEITDLSNALKVNPIKLKSKGIKSVKSRVTNISEHLDKKMNIIEFKDILMRYLASSDNNNKIYEFNNIDINNINKLKNEKYSTWDWNFGKSPKYALLNELKYPGGLIQFNLNVNKGFIEDIKFFGDFFGKKDVAFVENLFEGVKHNENSIRETLSLIPIHDYFLGADIDILVEGIMGVKSI